MNPFLLIAGSGVVAAMMNALAGGVGIMMIGSVVGGMKQ
jgi:hypothetical protein